MSESGLGLYMGVENLSPSGGGYYNSSSFQQCMIRQIQNTKFSRHLRIKEH